MATPPSPLNPWGSVSGNGGDNTSRCRELADAIIQGVREVNVTGGVESYRRGLVETGAGSRCAISTGTLGTVTGNGVDNASSRGNLPYAIVARIREIEISEVIHRYTIGTT